MVKIRLLKAWEHDGVTYEPGQYKFIEVDPATAKQLKDEGTAEDYSETSDNATKTVVQAGEPTSSTTADDIKNAVRDVVKELDLDKPVRKAITATQVEVKEAERFKKMGGFKGAGDFLKHVRACRTTGMTREMGEYLKFTAGHMEEGIDAMGGFLAPEDYRRQVLEIMHEEGIVAARCQQVPITGQLVKIPAIDETSRVDGSRYGGERGYTVAEGAQFTLSNPKIRMVKLEPSKKGTLTYVSDELDDDAFTSIAGLLARLAGKELAFIVDKEIIRGTGAGECLGILNAPCLVSVDGDTASSVVYEDIVNLWSRMFARSRSNAVWLINQDVEPQLFSMALAIGTGGAPAYLPANGLSGTPYATLMGRPVLAIEAASTLAAAGDVIFADLSQYLLGTKGGVQGAVSEHLRFDYDQNVYRASIRVDGQPWWNSALTPYQGSNTLSPFVTLSATRGA